MGYNKYKSYNKGKNNGKNKENNKKRKNNYSYDFSDSRFFVNPYVFNPLKGELLRSDIKDNNNRDTYSGEIRCSLYVKTPIIIPDTAKKVVKNEHPDYPFMKINEEYIIPASSIRGPIRSVYETLTNSCFSTEKKEQAVTARSSAPYKPGIIKKIGDEWKLYDATRYIFRVEGYKPFPENDVFEISKEELDKYEYGDKVVFAPKKEGNEEYKKRGHIVGKYVDEILGKEGLCESKGEYETGLLYIGEKIFSKHFESIFVEKEEVTYSQDNTSDEQMMNDSLSSDTSLDNTSSNSTIPSETIYKAFKKIREVKNAYQDKAINRNLGNNHYGYKRVKLDNLNDGDEMPIWYSFNGDKLYFSLACIGRYAYDKTLNDILDKHDSCKERKNVCKACALFGMLGDKGKEGIGSSVRVTDAHYCGNPVTKMVTLEELGSPKPSYIPFYIDNGIEDGYDSENAKLKGRKYYWHHNPIIEKKVKKTNRNSTVEIIETGHFDFSVYYDGISKEQLDELLWVLCLGENEKTGKYCFKFGHGKPLGYGSSKIVVNENIIREYADNEYVIKNVTNVQCSNNPFGEEWNKLKSVMTLDFMANQDVRYPYVYYDNDKGFYYRQNDIASHKWFSKNHPKLKKDGKIEHSLITLGTGESKEYQLPAVEIK